MWKVIHAYHSVSTSEQVCGGIKVVLESVQSQTVASASKLSSNDIAVVPFFLRKLLTPPHLLGYMYLEDFT